MIERTNWKIISACSYLVFSETASSMQYSNGKKKAHGQEQSGDPTFLLAPPLFNIFIKKIVSFFKCTNYGVLKTPKQLYVVNILKHVTSYSM